MASAQTEPSMDEILASIRRIISEEDEAPQEVPVRQKLETLTLQEDQAIEDEEPEEAPAAKAPAPRAKPKAVEAKAAEEEAPAETVDEPEAEASEDVAARDGADHVAEDEAQAEAQNDGLDDFEPLPEEPAAAAPTMEPAAEAHGHDDIQDETFDMPASHAVPQPAVQAVAEAVRPAAMAAAAEQLSISEESADQAASAFGALEENMRLSAGSGRTIEDLIEAMLAPMLKDWLDQNLPRIVEDKVEEEVRRISRRR